MRVLKTEKLALYHLTTADADFMVELMNEPGFIHYVADRGIRTTADAASYLSDKIIPSYAKIGFGFYRVELKEAGQPIGICGLAKRDTLEEVDIGFAILERNSGQGYAFEAAAATMQFGGAVLGLKSIIGVTAPDNHASIHLLNKLGLSYCERVYIPGFAGERLIFS